jgi:hypothetical protein
MIRIYMMLIGVYDMFIELQSKTIRRGLAPLRSNVVSPRPFKRQSAREEALMADGVELTNSPPAPQPGSEIEGTAVADAEAPVAPADVPAAESAIPGDLPRASDPTPDIAVPFVLAVISRFGDTSVAELAVPATLATFAPPPTETSPVSEPGATLLPRRKMPDNCGFVLTRMSTSVFFTSLAVAGTANPYFIGDADATNGAQQAATSMWSWWNEWKHIGVPAAGTLVGLIGARLFALNNREFS